MINYDFVAQQDIFIDMKRKKTKHISIRLTDQQYQRLMEMLKSERITKSELVRLALADYLEKS
jgi:predicted DNA-binding protein